MAVADIPAELIVNRRTSWEQFLWRLPTVTEQYRWDQSIVYMYALGATPVAGQGLPPTQPLPDPEGPFTRGEVAYLNTLYIRTINGAGPDENGDVEVEGGGSGGTVDQFARDQAQSALSTAQGKYTLPTNGIPEADLAASVLSKLNLGGTAYQKPSTGIPNTDLTSGARTSLGKADTAYQKPSTGIPAGDLTSAIQAQLTSAATAVQPADLAPYAKSVNGYFPDGNGNVQVPTGSDGGGSVDSVNGRIGAVALTKDDVQLSHVDDTSDEDKPASAAVREELALRVKSVNGSFPDSDGNVQIEAGGGSAGVTSVNTRTGDVTLAKGDVGLDQVDNTSDANKPVSGPQSTAIGAKYTKPSTGIPATDLTSDAQTKLARGGSAVTSVAGKSPDSSGAVALGASDVGAAPTSHTHTASQISDATSVGRGVLQAATAAAARQVIGAGIGTVKTVNGVSPDANGAVSYTTVKDSILAALSGTQMVTEGHSFMVGSGVNSPQKWAEQFAAMMGFVYPTSPGSTTTGDLMRAVGGSSAEEISQRAFGGGGLSYKWRLGDRISLLSENLINTSRRTGQVAAAKTGALHSVRGLVALACSDRAYVAGDTTFFTYSSGWTDTSVSVSMSGTVKTLATSATSAGNVTFSMPSPGKAWVLVLSRNASLQGNQVRVYNMSKGTLQLAIFDNTNTSASDTPGTYITIPIEIHAEPGDTIRIDAPGANRLGNFSFDGLLVAGRVPAPVFLMKEPYLNDYSLSTQYPKGSDAVFDYFNDVHDQVAAEFGNVVVANPNTAGYWDKTTMIQSDGVHPNVAGSTALAQTMRDAAYAQLPRILARGALGLN